MNIIQKIRQDYSVALIKSQEQASIAPIVEMMEKYNNTAELFGIDLVKVLGLNQAQIDEIKSYQLSKNNQTTENLQAQNQLSGTNPIIDLTQRGENTDYEGLNIKNIAIFSATAIFALILLTVTVKFLNSKKS